MTRRLAATVIVRDPSTGADVMYRKGDVPAEWAAAAITNPNAWEAEEESGDDPGVVVADSDAPTGTDEVGDETPSGVEVAAPAGDDPADVDEAAGEYGDLTVAELRAEIKARNEARGDEESLIPVDMVKADLVAALVADDLSGD